MAYPPGISLAVIQAGKAGTFFGDSAGLTATVTPVLGGTKYLVHSSTGDLMVPSPMTFTAQNDSVLSFSVPHVDQPGYLDDNAQAYTMWAYKIDITVLIGNGRQIKKHTWTKNFQPLVGQDFIDIDQIASGVISDALSAPLPEVLSVNGQTGHVTFTGDQVSDQALTANLEAAKDYADAKVDDGEVDAFRVRDKSGAVAFQVSGDGTVEQGGATTAPLPDSFRIRDNDENVAFEVTNTGDVITGGTTVSPLPDTFRVKDNKDRIAFEIRPDGSTFIGDLITDNEADAAKRVVLVLGMGQSNMEGRGNPYGSTLDPQDPRLLMWEWSSSTVEPATVPLSSHSKEWGLSVATEFARNILDEEPSGTIVAVINAGVSETPLVGDHVNGTWNPNYTGSNPKLFTRAMNAYTAARLAIIEEYGVAPEVRVIWHQGESDAGVSTLDYANTLDALIAATRTVTGASTTFTVGGMVPNWVDVAEDRKAIRVAHVDTPARNLFTAYADGARNGGGAASTSDTIHYSRSGVERLGASMYRAYRRAAASTNGSVPTPPPVVTAEKFNGVVTAKWEPPMCRVTAYIAEYSTDSGATWTAFPARTAALETTATATTTGATLVRVATANPNGTSAYTTPVPAIGA